MSMFYVKSLTFNLVPSLLFSFVTYSFLFQINSCKHSKLFIEFLLSLGWPVDSEIHPGWNGNVHKSWVPNEDDPKTKTQRKKGIDQSNMLASSMSTITSSTSTMGREGDITPSSDEESWFVRDQFLTNIHRESQDSEVTQSDRVTQDDSGTQSESASDVESVTQVDAVAKDDVDSSQNVTQKDSDSQEDSVTQSAESVTQRESVTQSDSVTQSESVTERVSVTQRPTSEHNDPPRIPEAKITSPEKSFDKEVNQILYYADISGEIAFVVPALLPQYQRFRKMIVKGESTSDEDNEEVDETPKENLRVRSGSMGSLEIKSASTSSMELRLPLSRQASDGFAAFGSRSRFPDTPPDTGYVVMQIAQTPILFPRMLCSL